MMPWKETNKMEQKELFIKEMLKNDKPFKHLCAEFGISEKTGYKWKKRFYEMGKSGLKEQTRQIPGIRVHPLFQSRVYLITTREDPLAKQNRVTQEDLYGRTLMVGGGSPPALKAVQHRLTATGKVSYFNSSDHDTTLTNVAAGRGVCLAPGFLNVHSNQFAWIPYDCPETFSCVLCTHKTDNCPGLTAFLKTLTQLYIDAIAFPL